MAKTRVKICGITRPEDAALAADLGADAIGLNFVRGPRRINFERAGFILDALPPLVSAVALVGESALAKEAQGELPHSLESLLYRGQRRTVFSTFQVYAENPPVADFEKLPETFSWWWVVSIEERESLSILAEVLDEFDLCPPAALLLDAAIPGQLGGTGQTFNWHWIAEAREAGELEGLPPIILAGGLTPENVAEAIRIARPYAVDVASGVEVAGKPGVKDPVKMRDFIQAAKSV